jgi:ABC-type bacteriocin/lantibiotic exporter with double-glycine peptidase domain
MIKVLKIIRSLKEIKAFYVLIAGSIILSLLEYLFIFLIFSLINYKISGHIPASYNNFISFFEEITKINFNTFSFFFLTLILVFFLKTILYIFYNFFISYFSQKISYKLSKEIIARSINGDKILTNQENSSFYKNTIIVDVPMFVSSVLQPLLFLINDSLVFFGILFFLFLNNSLISFYLSTFVICTCLIFYFYIKNKLIVWGKFREQSSLNLIQNLNEVYRGILEIKIYNVENFFFKKILKNLHKTRIALTNTGFFIHFPRIILEIIIFFSLFFLLYLSASEANYSVIPYLSALLAASIKMIPMFSRIMTSIQGYYFAKLVVKKIYGLVIKSDKDFFGNGNILTKPSNIQYIKITKLSCQLNKNYLFKNINLLLKKGSIVGITGESGVGKSTITRIIAGTHSEFSGHIKYYDDNNNLILKKPVLGSASIIPQDVFVFDDTLLKNISFNHHSDLQFKNKKNYQFFFNKMKVNLKRKLGEDGKKISGGEKQRLGVMRSLIFDKEIIIFDESTSNLDYKNKLRLFKIINILKKSKIILVISHDKSFLEICDKVFILKNTKLIMKR